MGNNKNTRHINADVLRMLSAKSGGFCQNPECNTDLYPLFQKGSIATIREAAHIIGFSEDGPRGNHQAGITEINSYENLILLCPSCHTKIDKASSLFPSDLLFSWKNDHEAKIQACFHVPLFKSKNELANEISTLLRQNRVCFETYGPHSRDKHSLLTDAPDMWKAKIFETIIPNNRLLLEMFRKNTHLLSPEEREVVEEFALHKEGFEFNHSSGDKNTSVPLFPLKIYEIIHGGQ